jgi:hypothetical protein
MPSSKKAPRCTNDIGESAAAQSANSNVNTLNLLVKVTLRSVNVYVKPIVKSGVNMNINPMEHFRAVEAKVRYERKKLEKAQIKEIKAKHNIRTIVVGDYTICYRVDKRDVIELSTAIRHPNDRFDRHVGELTALLKFCDMNRILLKNKMRVSPKQFLRFIFTAADYSQP